MLENETENADAKIYELGYLLVPSMQADDVPARYGDLKELIESSGGEVISGDMPKMINLAYCMSKVISNTRHKFNSAYFGWVKFTMEAPEVVKLKERLDLDPNFIRFMILKTVKENTIATKRFERGSIYRRPIAKRSAETVPSVPINKEEIDKEIDALVQV